MLSKRIFSKRVSEQDPPPFTGIATFSKEELFSYIAEKGFIKGSLIVYDYSIKGEDPLPTSSPALWALIVEVCIDPKKLANHYGDRFPRAYRIVDVYSGRTNYDTAYVNPPRWITGEFHRLLMPQEQQKIDDKLQNYIKELLETHGKAEEREG